MRGLTSADRMLIVVAGVLAVLVLVVLVFDVSEERNVCAPNRLGTYRIFVGPGPQIVAALACAARRWDGILTTLPNLARLSNWGARAPSHDSPNSRLITRWDKSVAQTSTTWSYPRLTICINPARCDHARGDATGRYANGYVAGVKGFLTTARSRGILLLA